MQTAVMVVSLVFLDDQNKLKKKGNKNTLEEFLVRLKTETANLQAFRTPCVGILKQSYASALLSLQTVKIQQVSP